MAELALAIIPLGLKTCSGLVSYLDGLKDHDNALVRLKRLAESLEGSFRLLNGFLKSGQLNPSTSQAAAQALRCLADCENGLKDLKAFGQKISATTASDLTVKDTVKSSYRRLSYPLRQAQLSQLENTLGSICTPLNLAIQGLQLEMQAATSKAIILNATVVKNTALEVSALAAAVSHLSHPVSTIGSQLPTIQIAVDELAPQIHLMIEASFKTQMDEIRESFQQAESAALQRRAQTAELLSRLNLDAQNPAQAVRRLVAKPSLLCHISSSASACSCMARRLRTRKTLPMGPLSFKDEVVSHCLHFKDCDFYTTAIDSSRERTLRFTGLTRLIGRAIELTVRTTVGAGGFSISPSINYFAMVDEVNSPAFRVINLLVESRLGARWAMESYPGLLFESITRKLQVIFRSGKARPTDINSKGYSLLHHLTLTLNSGNFRILTQQQRAHPNLKSLFDFLIAAGTPVAAVGSDGRLALHVAADEFVLPSSILAQLCVDDVEIPAPRRPELRFGNFGRIDVTEYDGQDFEGLAPRTFSRSGNLRSTATEFDARSNEPGNTFQKQATAELIALETESPADSGRKEAKKPIFRPIWLDITCPGDASIFWHRGFTDIDDAWTHPSLSKQAFGAFGPDVSQALHCTSPHRSERSSFTLAEIIINNRKNLEKYLIRDPLAIEYTDSCTCQCSPEGYTPFTHGIRCLLESDSSGTDGLRSFAQELGGILTMYQHTAVLRQAIFANLDMVHTCFTEPECRDELLDDRIYTATDDSDKAAFIDSVIVEFKRFMLKDADATNREGENEDMYLFRGTREYHQRSLKFWDHILPSMIGDFEQTLASTWNPDIEALRDLGVTLWIEEEKKQKVCARVYEVRRDDEESRRMAFEELLEKLEMIE
ncbi:hypothetical protein FPRO05_05157 [Fusarium proliferatum]|uniref:Fungal N-terminal domain-containing protein n=1 Tax=Gibberella intermedia TaxID=948311 RepID=A0A365MQ62_GIBIN|nr:hypothetical protein FPRO05_05157 [Fusarium proliferatum]